MVEAPVGHLQLAPATLRGARGGERGLAPLEVPASYDQVRGTGIEPAAPAYNVAQAYAQILRDAGIRLVPDFAHAVRRHETLQAILDAAGPPWTTRGA